MAVEPQLLGEVEGTIAKVTAAQAKALTTLRAKFGGGDVAANGIKAISSLTPRVTEWAANGRKAAASGKAPEGRGWPGWIAAGDIIIDGFEEIVGVVLAEPLAMIAATKAVSDASVKVAKVAADATKAVAATTGEVAASLLRPLLLPLGIIAAVALVAYSLVKKAAP